MATQTIAKAKTVAEAKAEAAVRTGPASAAMISGGVGALVIGLMTTGAELFAGLKTALNWFNPAGPLSGKTGVGVILWLVFWVVLNNLWKDKDYELRKAFTITLVLIGLGLLLTFPPVFEAFAH